MQSYFDVFNFRYFVLLINICLSTSLSWLGNLVMASRLSECQCDSMKGKTSVLWTEMIKFDQKTHYEKLIVNIEGLYGMCLRDLSIGHRL